MTIEKGKAWGRPGTLPDDGLLVRGDGEARAALTAARLSGRTPPVLGLLGGDLARAVGARGDADRLRSGVAQQLTIDAVAVRLDGEPHWCVAHLVARRRLWAGRFVAVMNTEWLGDMKIAPRAHPNDGLVDVVDGRLGIDDRLKARRRVRTGDHLPHPSIGVRRVTGWEVDLDVPTPVWLDGERVGRVRCIEVEVEPDALVGVV